ncbi:hypothetical protein HAZT_HAZT001281 [Hyalella azteca]|uniref:Reverse transcriptase domain-containing protein n=1 Tax=Hyalella azteca TaxID=294128 RepID=A0A6A0HC10_HYAAZ|nr:hypothetical protein HAZT_HAZT001281 [Hyalella azteca]
MGQSPVLGILNDQFCNAFTRGDLSDLPAPAISPHPNIPDISVSTIGVRKLLSGLNPKKAAGPDKIPCRLLRDTAAELAHALTALFNRSLSTGVVPAIWKHALVLPVFKKGDRGQAANYRPISFTCVYCKLLVQIIRLEITDHLDRNNILSYALYGFRKRRCLLICCCCCCGDAAAAVVLLLLLLWCCCCCCGAVLLLLLWCCCCCCGAAAAVVLLLLWCCCGTVVLLLLLLLW